MTRQTDELDRLIDAMNHGDEVTINAVTDPDMAALLNAVMRIRRLQAADWPEADWPALAVSHLSRDLRADKPSVVDPASLSPEPNHAQDDTRLGPSASTPMHPAPKPPKRMTIPRELAQIAAAILVLVLVGGVLAVVFHGQGGSDQGGVGAGATPTSTTGSPLPMTVTASGVSLELQSVDSTSTVTRFSFMIRLSPDQVSRNQPFPSVLGSNPANDVTIDGITPGSGDPYMTESDGMGKNPSVAFTLDYQSPFPKDKTVTITIKHLTLPTTAATPGSDRTTTSTEIDGPWTFTITPVSVANQPTPTPFSSIGRFGGVSATQAQKWTSFPITAPSALPPPLNQTEVIKRNTFNVTGYAVGVPETVAANYVMFIYTQPFGQDVWLVETTNDAAVPNVEGDSATVLMPVPPSGASRTLAISPGSLLYPKIGGVTVTRFEVSNSASTGPTVYYVWRLGDIGYYIRYVMDTPPAGQTTVTESDLQEMVSSIIERRGGAVPATVTSGSPPFTLTFAQAKQIVSFYIAEPTWVPSYLADKGAVVMAPPRQTPTPQNVHDVSLEYGPVGVNQQYSVSIGEFDSTKAPRVYDGTSSIVTIAGKPVTRTVATRTKSTDPHILGFTWSQEGTYFWLDAQMGGPMNEQDLEHMIASIIDQSGVSATPKTQATLPATAQEVIPTPNQSGIILGITFKQAQQLTPFKLFMPTYIPPPLKYDGIDVEISPFAQAGVPKGTPTRANLDFRSGDSPFGSVTLLETSVDLNPNNVGGAEVPVTNAAGTPTVMPANGVVTTITVAGATVTRHDVANQDGKVISVYFWKQDGTTMMLSAFVGYSPSEQDLEHMIASMIGE